MSLRLMFLSPARHEPGGIQQYSRVLMQGLLRCPVVEVTSAVEYTGSRLRFLLSVLGGLLRKRVDAVWMTHPHFLKLLPLFRVLNIPVLVSCHGIEVWESPPRWMRRALRQARCVLPVSRYTRDRVQESTGECRFHIFPNHLEEVTRGKIQKAEARACLGWALDEKVLLIVGRIAAAEGYKGHRQLLEVLPELVRRIPSAKLVIVGDGDGRQDLVRVSESLQLQKHVRFMGRLDPSTLDLCYLAGDAFAMPSVGEGFGIVFLEALSYGLPVLAGNRDGSVDALADGELGLLVDPDNPEALLQGLVDLLDEGMNTDSEKRRKKVMNQFGPDALDRRINDLLKKLCVELQAG